MQRGRRAASIAMILLGVIAVLAVAACGSSKKSSSASASSSAKSKGPIVIAASLGLTGPLSFYDVPFLEGTKAGIAYYNSHGGIMGRKIKLITNDNGSNISQIPSKAQALIAQHPVLLLTSNSDTTGIPAARVAQQAGQLVMGASGPTDYGSQVGSLVFNDWHGDPTEAAVAKEFLQQKKITKVITAEDLSLGYTKDICTLFRKTFSQTYPNGIVGQVTYNSTTDTTFPSQVSTIRGAASRAQAVVICGLVTGTPALINEMRAAGVNLPIFGMGGGLDGDYWTSAIPHLGTFYSDSVGAINPLGGSTYPSNPNPTEDALINKITKQTGKRPVVGHVFIGYTVIQMLAAAIKATNGDTSSTALAQAMDKFHNLPTLVGNTTYTPSCHVPTGRNLAITQVVNGKGKYLETITPKPQDVPKAPC